jgi:hypothetical protein
MKSSAQVLILSNAIDTILPQLEAILLEEKAPPIKWIHPSKIYNTDLKESDYVILEYEWFVQHPEVKAMMLNHMEKVSLFATVQGQEEMNRILKETGVNHFFGMSGSHTLHDIANYLMASMDRRFWTAETFIQAPITAKSHSRFESSDHLEDQINRALDSHDLSNTFEGFKPILEKILNETLTNALFNAPLDGNGKPLYRQRNRKEVVHADPNKIPTLDVMEDSEKIILTVRDFYGSLDKKVIDHYLTHGQIAEKEGGAGVGLFLILRDAHKLVINIDPGKMTEFIIVLHKFKRFFHYQALEKSFHLFERKSS